MPYFLFFCLGMITAFVLTQWNRSSNQPSPNMITNLLKGTEYPIAVPVLIKYSFNAQYLSA
ncbi:MAG: hypothetical protein AAGD09_21375 [Cyanobacteria bacterium P01_F01_bin.56]